jgi:hypothetical protein
MLTSVLGSYHVSIQMEHNVYVYIYASRAESIVTLFGKMDSLIMVW